MVPHRDDLHDVIDAITFPNGATHMKTGLEQVERQVFTLSDGMRPFADAVPRVLIVLTDGKSNPTFEP